ncbi:DUF4159 domain-containing protein [Rhodobaculum claviforme]|uniref:LytTR family transcriptional regulator n=1 Tax=Rhodobaculum claviforme TaxID=1549854 RepID=A0A934TJ64_9RHOB|nr:DUF4159 domain-containing protein [Rhodobaculum claviforme]MBK5926619.1 LytTR family transcriptional regulator [Rhodobaculum claviforme]
MMTLGSLGFAAPGLLLALLALPVVWWLLRAVPPAPVVRRFPGVVLLLGLRDSETETDRTPWWLLALRLLAIAAVIVGFSGPVLNPAERSPGTGPLLILIDASWASARDWPRHQDRVTALLADAGRAGRPVAVATLSELAGGEITFRGAEYWSGRVAGLVPRPWAPPADVARALEAALGAAETETVWLSDGLDRPGRADVLAVLEARGPVRVIESPRPALALRPARFESGLIHLEALRSPPADSRTEVTITAHGPDPSGVERELARGTAAFGPGAAVAGLSLSLQPELRNRITRFQIAAERGAGTVSLTDDGLQRRKVALLAPRDGREGLELLSPLFYLRQALEPVADLIDGGIDDILLAAPDVIILADIARVTEVEADMLTEWMEGGGLLVRFAGPRLAASDVSRGELDPLMPVRLRAGGRTVGGAMSWGAPRQLEPFDETSPFHGLAVPEDVTVSAQVLAQPDPELAQRGIARLADGTPLVTRRAIGQGQVVLFHVTANAEWSTLPLSGLFVQMLERLAISTRPARPDAADLVGATWTAERVMDGFGAVAPAGTMAGVDGAALGAALEGSGPDAGPGAGLPPGVYAADDRRVALNVAGAGTTLAPATWPARIPVEGLETARETPLKGALLSLAFVALMADILAALAVSGRLMALRGAAVLALALLMHGPAPAHAQTQDQAQAQEQAPSDDRLALRATAEVVLAHVLTGDPRIDQVAEAGLRGLSRTLFERTTVEPADPIGIDLETDELAFFPFLYWPVTEGAPTPSEAAYARLNRYLRAGGMILFDTRDADMAGFGFSSPAGRRLQEIARPLDIPPLEPVPDDHVLTRTFYLIQDFPGRHTGQVWVEASAPDAERAEGMPFRNLNDGVSPVVIGGNDWAAAWAVNERGRPMMQIGRGAAGDRQREIAHRFGVNLIMHVLTGNYKSDQVHVPALLERLGQ